MTVAETFYPPPPQTWEVHIANLRLKLNSFQVKFQTHKHGTHTPYANMASIPLGYIFERQILPEQTIYRCKGNLTASRIHFKYWKNILISQFYEQFSRNDSKNDFKRISDSTHEHIIYHFKARGLDISNMVNI